MVGEENPTKYHEQLEKLKEQQDLIGHLMSARSVAESSG